MGNLALKLRAKAQHTRDRGRHSSLVREPTAEHFGLMVVAAVAVAAMLHESIASKDPAQAEAPPSTRRSHFRYFTIVHTDTPDGVAWSVYVGERLVANGTAPTEQAARDQSGAFVRAHWRRPTEYH